MSSLMHLTGIHRWRGSRVSQSALGFFGVVRPLVKEYWCIYEQPGYHDFNAFLHHYRIREACEMLGDPDRSRIPILTIALCRFCVVTPGA